MATPFPFGSGNVLTAAQMNAITTLPINDQTASYVALVGDVGKRIVMNVATANTVTINDSVFAAGDTIFIANKGAGATTVTAGAGVTINTASSAVLAQHGGGTLVATSASVFTFFSQQSATYGTATGGNSSSSITVSGVNYTLLTFTSSGTLTVTKSGLFDVYIIAGGGSGAGGTSASFAAGGGGAGSRAQATLFLTANQTVTIGAQGAGGSVANGSNGSISSFGSLLATAGGGAGNRTTQAIGQYLDGGCGGGGGDIFVLGSTNVGNNFGFNGGASNITFRRAGGGGGGVSAVGGSVTSTTGGAGGAGDDVSTFIGGSPLFKGGGGGAAGLVGGAAGNASAGAGGSGASGDGTAAAANSGSGGGSGNTSGSAGGAGICFVRFKI